MAHIKLRSLRQSNLLFTVQTDTISNGNLGVGSRLRAELSNPQLACARLLILSGPPEFAKFWNLCIS